MEREKIKLEWVTAQRIKRFLITASMINIKIDQWKTDKTTRP